MTKNSRKLFLIAIFLFTFGAWFADGYLQWINSDTAGEASGVSQYLGFPYALIAPHYKFHARITATLLSYIPFHTIGYFYRQITHDPVNALYVSQGAMTGLVYVLFLLTSAAYVSFSASILSSRYLISAAILMLLMIALPVLPLDAPLSLTVHFRHQSVMTNYVGTLMIALFALYPYWRLVCTGKWEDWYSDIRLRILFYTLIIAAVFSSTATMLWLGIVAGLGILSIVGYERKLHDGCLRSFVVELLKNSKVRPLLLIIALVIAGAIAESVHPRSNSAFASIHSLEYLRTFILFLQKGSHAFYALVFCGFFAIFASWYGKKRLAPASWNTAADQGGIRAHHKTRLLTSHQASLYSILPWLISGNLAFIFVIGLPKVPYRFGGYNLGPDTMLPATWTLTLWLTAAILDLWKNKILTWMAPPLIFAMITSAAFFFLFPGYKSREIQRQILSRLYQENISVAIDRPLPIPVENMAFSAHECRVYSIPLLRQMGIISSQRQIAVVPQLEYNAWHTE